jgi:hypothetical protein
MGMYLESGYFNARWVLSSGLPINLVDGGRGTGKTYTTLLTMLEDGRKFMLFRRTQSQIDIISKPEFSPFKSITRDHPEFEIMTAAVSKYTAGIYKARINDEGKQEPDGAPLGYMCALSTFSNLRGFDASDVEVLVFDEYIPERHERPIKNEAAALLNAYETINRNRELSGHKPLQLICLANANDFACDLHVELNIVTRMESMQKRGQSVMLLPDRGIGVFLLNDSPIGARKRDTALYRAAGDGDFSAMALDNRFSDFDTSLVVSRNLAEYKPIISCGEICLYKHKSAREWFVSDHKSGSPDEYPNTETGRAAFRRAALPYWLRYLRGSVKFDSWMTEKLWKNYMGM